MAEAEQKPVVTSESDRNPTMSVTEKDSDQKTVVPMDGFEAEELKENVLRQESQDSQDLPFNYYSEHYSGIEDTTLEIGKETDVKTFDLLRDLDKLERLRRLELDNEVLQERVEVAALIKKAEEKLIPKDKVEDEEPIEDLENKEVRLRPKTEIVPELVTLDSTLPPPDLIRMESDLSDEESYRLRLSCILEESESDSGSGITRTIRVPPEKTPNSETDPKVINQQHSNAASKQETLLSENTGGIAQVRDALEESQEITETEKEILQPLESQNIAECVETTNNDVDNIDKSAEQHPESPNTQQSTAEAMEELDNQLLEDILRQESTESPISISPEPQNFSFQRLKSGSHVDKLLTKPGIASRRLESSSESSLDLSLPTPSIEGETAIIEEAESPTAVDSAASRDTSVKEIASEDDGKRVFPKLKRGRRGKSLETAMADRKKEEIEGERKNKKRCLETCSQKGDEDRPPVPPETYLWEELRRWRLKGGYPWTYLDKPPFDEKSWKKKVDHEYEPINPPPHEKDAESKIGKEVGDKDNEHRFLRIPNDDELVVSAEDMEVEAIANAQDLQDELDDRFLATTPMTNATTASRTDCDVNTSMLDSSGLEDLPLKRDSRSKKAIQSKTDQMRAQAQGIQQRIRSQAGKLRNKLRSIPRPSFQRRQERSRQEPEEKSKFRLPERPKFTLPERPKFTLPERPKFSLPERAKLKMPQKPKLTMPNFSKPLRERQQQSGSGTKKNLFDLDFRTYPRIFSKKSKDRGDYATSSPKLPRSATPPPAPLQPARKKGPVGQRWVNRFDDIKYVDDRASEVSRRSERSESLSGFHDRDFAIADDLETSALPPPRALSTKSSMSHLDDSRPQSSRSSEERQPHKGVIEEIDSDQFFLRQKGISEENIDMGKYLSEEIREAFKSPVVNALRQMDYDYDNEVDSVQGKENVEPLPPSRTRSLKKQRKIKEASPVRRSPIQLEEEPRKSRYENVEEDANGEHYKTPPPPVEYQHYKVPRSSRSRKTTPAEESSRKKKQNGWVEVEIETSMEEVPDVPQPSLRRKSKKRVVEGQPSQEEIQGQEEIIEPDYIIPDTSAPEPPRRTRSLSRGPQPINQGDLQTMSLSRPIKSIQAANEMQTRSLPRPDRTRRSFAQDRETKTFHSLNQTETKTPIPPKRASSRSLHSLGLGNDRASAKRDLDSRSVKSLVQDEPEPPKRLKSLSRGSRSFHSLNADEEQILADEPVAPERTRSLSRASRSYHSLADDESGPHAPERTRSLSRASKNKGPAIETVTQAIIEPDHYEIPLEDGYAVVDKSTKDSKPKPPRPPPPRRKRETQSLAFNTFPKRSPIRPIRNYATLGPSRPPRQRKPIKLAQSLEHIYTDQVSQAYVEIETTQVDDLHGSNKDLQTDEVIEKMKGRPLPAPPRPPRLKTKSEEPGASFEEIEEVCVSTQTDPLPDDVCLEDDIIQEFSHEQIKIQEAFLQEMREEEERIKREIEEKRSRQIDVREEQEQNLAKMEIIRQMDDLIQEERRLLFDRQPGEDEEAKKESQLQVFEDDMGYASLDRRQTRVEDEQPSTSSSFQQVLPPLPEPAVLRLTETTLSSSPQVPAPSSSVALPIPSTSHQDPVYVPLVPEIISTERLRVTDLEVDRLTVNELIARSIQTTELNSQGLRTLSFESPTLQIQDITSRSGNLNLGSIELPPDFVQQIIARIPWEDIRPPTGHLQPVAEEEVQQRKTAHDDDASPPQAPTIRRRHKHRPRSRSQYSSEDDEEGVRQVAVRRPRAVASEPTITELGKQLTRACTSAGLRAMRQFAAQVRPPDASEQRNTYVQVIVCIVLVLIASLILIGVNANGVHHHHWDFQFPPQPPKEI